MSDRSTLVPGPQGDLEVLRTGGGAPSTLLAHGLGGSIAQTRPFAGGVPGTRWYLNFRAHGRSAAPATAWTYAALAAELQAVARYAGGAPLRALGVSMGAGALLHAVAERPYAYERLVLVLPPALERRRPALVRRHFTELADAVEAADLTRIEDLLLAVSAVPADRTAAMRSWAAERAVALAGTAVARGMRELPEQSPVPDLATLAAVRCPVLVLGQDGDPIHPAQDARAVADALPRAELHVLTPGGLLWAHRARVRELVSTFLAG